MLCEHVTCVTVMCHVFVFFYFYFFLNHQFITRRVKADHGSYFRNCVHRKQTQMKFRKTREKEKERKQGVRTT